MSQTVTGFADRAGLLSITPQSNTFKAVLFLGLDRLAYMQTTNDPVWHCKFPTRTIILHFYPPHNVIALVINEVTVAQN